jgi:glycerate 2-kinase
MPTTPDRIEQRPSPHQLCRMRADAGAIFQAGLKAVAPDDAIRQHCRIKGDHLVIGERDYDLTHTDRIFVVGAGKATAAMAVAAEEILGTRISDGLISVKYHHGAALKHIRTIEAGHPIPDANGMTAAQQMLALVRQAGPQDLILVLISGGGSALMPLPIGTISLQEKQQTSDALIGCGATIHEINTIRKHISAIKGGRLAQAAAPAQVAALILSDVVGDDLDIIASGPTVPDASSYDHCLSIIERYALAEQLPASIRHHLSQGKKGAIQETPKATTHPWQHVHNLIVGSNFAAIQAAGQAARQIGYHTLILSSLLEGETRHVAKVHSAIAREILASGNPIAAPACILSGGETTVTLKAKGRGGRNQEFALAAALDIDGIGPITILSAGTDGTDGPTDAAGAIVDHTTIQRARQAGLDANRHLDNNDAYPLLQQLGELLITGPTHTNVMDLHIMIVQISADDGNATG